MFFIFIFCMNDINLVILYESPLLVVVNKPAGLETQRGKSGEKSLCDLIGEQLNSPKALHVVHRLDQPVSGAVVLAKTPKVAADLQKQWQEGKVQKTYLAFVNTAPPNPQGELRHYLRQNSRDNRSHAHEQAVPNSQLAVLQYRLMQSTDHYHLLELLPKTGKHHQIRAQLSAIGCPVKGDVKYGARRANPDRSIHLHALHLQFAEPFGNKMVSCIAPPPDNDALWQLFSTESYRSSITANE